MTDVESRLWEAQPTSHVPRLGDAALVVLFLAVVLVPFVQELTAQPAVRYAQTATLVEHGEFDLDRYQGVLGVDVVEHEGRLYSDKGPVQPLLAVPVFALGKAVGVEDATLLRVRGNLGLWWVTLWMSVVPVLAIGGIGVGVVRRLFTGGKADSERLGARHIVAPLVVCAGTTLFAYATELYAHSLTALLGWGCWLLVSRSPLSLGRAALAGAVAGMAVAVEYQMAIVVMVVAAVLVIRKQWSRLGAFVASGLPFAVGLAAYQWAVFGDPLSVSYGQKPIRSEEPAILGLPDPWHLVQVLVGSRGLLVLTPVVGLGVAGLIFLARQRSGEARDHGRVGLVVLAAYVLMQAAWPNPWGGQSPGPRYVIPALPFLIVGVAAIWNRAHRVRLVVVAWSVFAMTTVLVTLHLVPVGGYAVLSHISYLGSRGLEPTLWTMALGPAGWILHLATVVAVGWMVRDRVRSYESGELPAPNSTDPVVAT